MTRLFWKKLVKTMALVAKDQELSQKLIDFQTASPHNLLNNVMHGFDSSFAKNISWEISESDDKIFYIRKKLYRVKNAGPGVNRITKKVYW